MRKPDERKERHLLRRTADGDWQLLERWEGVPGSTQCERVGWIACNPDRDRPWRGGTKPQPAAGPPVIVTADRLATEEPDRERCARLDDEDPVQPQRLLRCGRLDLS